MEKDEPVDYGRKIKEFLSEFGPANSYQIMDELSVRYSSQIDLPDLENLLESTNGIEETEPWVMSEFSLTAYTVRKWKLKSGKK